MQDPGPKVGGGTGNKSPARMEQKAEDTGTGGEGLETAGGQAVQGLWVGDLGCPLHIATALAYFALHSLSL